uniref:IF rod domain-containing protein n=1 Tax=Hucho hucho TaxID=62062 RepID=A0A4W5LMC0_9TELE
NVCFFVFVLVISCFCFVLAAEKAAADLKKVEDAYETVYMEIRDLREKLSIDYGSEREFLFLHNQCFQLKVHE